MKDTKDMQLKACTKNKSPEVSCSVVASARPTKAELKQVIEKSIKKNKAVLQILAKR